MATPRTHDESRDQEVLRANRELAAYFRGKRTEREARAALKIIKAFIRDRQHAPADKKRPLPGMKTAPAPARKTQKKRRPSPQKRQSRSLTDQPTTIDAAQAERTNGEE